MLICIYIFYRIILCLTRRIKWWRTKKNEFSTWIFIKFDRFFFQRAIDHLEEIRDQDTVGNFHRRDERENMCHHWEEGKKKKIWAKDTFPRDPLIRTQTAERTLIEMEDKKQWEKAKKLFSWSDVQTAWVIRLKFVWARFHFYFAFVDWRNRPWFRLCTRSFYDYIGHYNNYILISISQECRKKWKRWKNNSSNFQFFIRNEFHCWLFSANYNEICIILFWIFNLFEFILYFRIIIKMLQFKIRE